MNVGKFDIELSRKLPLCRKLVTLLLLSVGGGCLTSPNPFYEEKDIVQDRRFVGTFVEDDLGLTVTISSDGVRDKHYSLQLTEGGKTSDYRATLFKLKDSLFVDLIPTSEKETCEQYIEHIPTPSGLLRFYSHDGKAIPSTRLHFLFRLSLSDKQIECFGAKQEDDPSNPIRKDSKLKLHSNADQVVLDEPTSKLRSIVGRYAGANWGELFYQNVFDGGNFKLTRRSDGNSDRNACQTSH
jgi:hypothetical protein